MISKKLLMLLAILFGISISVQAQIVTEHENNEEDEVVVDEEDELVVIDKSGNVHGVYGLMKNMLNEPPFP